MQLPLLMFHLTALVPIAELGDQLRQEPVASAATRMKQVQRSGELLAMVGAMKPSCISTRVRLLFMRVDRMVRLSIWPTVSPANSDVDGWDGR